MKLTAAQKEMLKGIPSKEISFHAQITEFTDGRRKVTVQAFKVDNLNYHLHKFGPDKIGMMTHFFTKHPVPISQIGNEDCLEYEEIEW